MHRPPRPLSPAASRAPLPLPGLRPGVVMIGEGDEAELRDLQLGQVVRLGEVASVIVGLLDGTRDAEALLVDAGRALGEELNPMGLVELLQALDRRALLDTPRARVVVAQGLVRADIAALQRLSRRARLVKTWTAAEGGADRLDGVRMAEKSQFACHSCTRCCSEQHLLGPLTRAERDVILEGFAARGDATGSDPSNFIPLPTGAAQPVYLLRPRDGRCSYLGPDRLCRVHRDLGIDSKPSVCRLFPFRCVRTSVGWEAGLTLSCPTVAAGDGPDPRPEILATLEALRGVPRQLLEAPTVVPLVPGVSVSWQVFREWETDALARIQDEAVDPARAWLQAVSSFSRMIDRGTVDPDFESTITTQAPGKPEQEPASGSGDFVPAMGLGTLADRAPEAADILLRELALWAELLVGLEAADPMALRRFRSGVLRVRAALGFSPEAAPVLAEMARIDLRQKRAAQPQGSSLPSAADIGVLPTDPMIPAVTCGGSPAVQRRFLAQEIMGKRLLEYGTAGRGLVALTLYLALLRLPELPGDELHPRVEDVAYLVHHPQLSDIIDTRAVVRATEGRPGLHASLLQLK